MSKEQHKFVGYDRLEVETEVYDLALKDRHWHVVLVDTPFYAESGGQVGDRGTIEVDRITLQVDDTQRAGDRYVCLCPLDEAFDPAMVEQQLWDKKVLAKVDRERRDSTTANHTATHLLHMALRRILGDHVHQSGSLVAPNHLRFDFTHWQRVEPEQLTKIERIVNDVVRDDHEVKWRKNIPYDEARRRGAVALFGEKYGDRVRVVQVGPDKQPVSLELCGGCHVRHTGQIGAFVITSEGSIASGVRRIEARTGGAAVQFVQDQRGVLQKVSALLGGGAGETAQRASELVQHARQLEKRIKALEAERSAQQARQLAAEADEIGGLRLIIRVFDEGSPAALKALAERLRIATPRTVAFLATTDGGSLGIVCAASDDLAAGSPIISSADIARAAAAEAGGGGGGRPTLATAGAKRTDNLDEVLEVVRVRLANALITPADGNWDWRPLSESFRRAIPVHDQSPTDYSISESA